MDRNWIGAVVGIVLVVVLLLLLNGGSISCRESFWDSDVKKIEIRSK